MAQRPKLQLKLRRQLTPGDDAAQATLPELTAPSPRACTLKRARSVVCDESQVDDVVEESTGLAMEPGPAQVRRGRAQSPEPSASSEVNPQVIPGTGGFGKVVSYAHSSDKLVQKIAFRDGHEAFHVEVQVLVSTTKHPHRNVLALHEAAFLTEDVAIVVPQAECDLLDFVNQGRMKAPFVAHFVRDILAGLVHLHALGWLHCDLSLENILLFPDPDGPAPWRCVICDFGSACKLQDGAGKPVTYARPKLLYAAPEQRTAGLVTTATDVFTVGVMARFMIDHCHGAKDELAPCRKLAAALEARLPEDRPSVHTALASIQSLL